MNSVIGEKDSSIFGKIIIAIFIIFTLITILAVLYFEINIGMELYRFVYRFYEEFGFLGVNIAVFIISIFGNFAIVFPVPYLFALVLICLLPDIYGDPLMLLILGFSAGIGASIGELSAWYLGRAGDKTFENSPKLKRMNKWIDKGYAPYLILFFAATPLPDDAFMVVLGLANYSLKKTLLFCFLGKVVLTCSAAFLASIAGEMVLGQWLLQLYGINMIEVQSGVIQQTTFEEVVVSTFIWILTIIIITGLVLIDWNNVYHKLKGFKKRNELKNNPKTII